jgi:hypothetical protein
LDETQTSYEICISVVDLWNKTNLQNPPNQDKKNGEEVKQIDFTKKEIEKYLCSLKKHCAVVLAEGFHFQLSM